jgi:hypothetical protein
MSETESTSNEPTPINPTKKPRQCRFIKTNGEQCRSGAMTGNHYCFSHKFNRKPSFTGVRGYDRVAFLEDSASIQLILSQVLQGLLDHLVDPNTARSAFYGCSVAAGMVRFEHARERWLAENKQPVPEQVTETTKSEDSEPLAPEKEYRGPTGTFEPQWSFAKYLYEQQCEQAGKPKPTCAADFPASGWLTEDEIKEGPDAFNERLNARSLEQMEKDRVEAINNPRPPEPVDGPEWTDEDMEFMLERCWCGGMEKGNPCDYCLNRHQRYEAHLRKQRENPPAPQQPSDQQSNQPNEQPNEQNTDNEEGTVDLNAAAEPIPNPYTPNPCPSERCTLNAERCCSEPCQAETFSLLPIAYSLPLEVPKEKCYPPTCTKQSTCKNNPPVPNAEHSHSSRGARHRIGVTLSRYGQAPQGGPGNLLADAPPCV